MGCTCDPLVGALKERLRDLDLAHRELRVEERALKLYARRAAREARLQAYEVAGAVGEVIELVGQAMSLTKDPGAIVALVGKSIAVVTKLVSLADQTITDDAAEEWDLVGARVRNAVDRVAQSVDRAQDAFTAFWDCAEQFVPRTLRLTIDASADVAAGGFRAQSTVGLDVEVPLAPLVQDTADTYRDRLRAWLADGGLDAYRGSAPGAARVPAYRLVGQGGAAVVQQQSFTVAASGLTIRGAVVWSRIRPCRVRIQGVAVTGSQPLTLQGVVQVFGQSQSLSTTINLADQLAPGLLLAKLRPGATPITLRRDAPDQPWVYEHHGAADGVRRSIRVAIGS